MLPLDEKIVTIQWYDILVCEQLNQSICALCSPVMKCARNSMAFYLVVASLPTLTPQGGMENETLHLNRALYFQRSIAFIVQNVVQLRVL